MVICRLLRGEGRLVREINLSVWLISNELLEVDLRLDSRVQSAMSGENVFFPPYGVGALSEVVDPRVERAFPEDALSDAARHRGVKEGASRWGDARKTLRLFRQAGETATERGLDTVTEACIETNLETTEREATIEKLLKLPAQHLTVLSASTCFTERRSGDIVQPVTLTEVRELLSKLSNNTIKASV